MKTAKQLTADQLQRRYDAAQRKNGIKLKTVYLDDWPQELLSYLDWKCEQLQVSRTEVIVPFIKAAGKVVAA